MTEEEFSKHLKIAIEKTGVQAFREKSDPSHPSYVPGIRESIALIARGELRKPNPLPPDEILPNADPKPFHRPENIMERRLEQYSATTQEEAREEILVKPRPDFAKVRAALSWAASCIYREKGNNQGCGCFTCHAGRGSGLDRYRANNQDCFKCFNEAMPESSRIPID